MGGEGGGGHSELQHGLPENWIDGIFMTIFILLRQPCVFCYNKSFSHRLASSHKETQPANIYLFEVNNRNTRKTC